MDENQKALEMSVDTKIAIELTAGEWSSILYGIDELPRKIAQPLHEKVNAALISGAKNIAKELNTEAEVEEVK